MNYAIKRLRERVSIPAVFTARIQVKYLLAANNSYEAGLPPEHRDKLQNVQVQKLNLAEYKYWLFQFNPEALKVSEKIKSSVLDSINRLNAHHGKVANSLLEKAVSRPKV